MRNIKELYHRLTEQKDFDKRYPIYAQNDGKVHVLFISPCLNGTGYYRAIVPMLELNGTNTHVAIITDLHKWDFNEQLTDYVTPVDERLIQWADYIVLPSMLADASYLIRGWRNQNPDAQLVMDMDTNIHALPKQHFKYLKISGDQKKQLLSNLAQMDMVTGVSKELLVYYDALLERYYPSSEVAMEYLPNLISRFGYQEIEPIQAKGGEKIRIGIIGTSANYYDTLSILEVLQKLDATYGDEIELVLFGWDGSLPRMKNVLDGFRFAYQKPVGLLNYFHTLHNLALDIALIPFKNIAFNTHGKSFIRYLEFAVSGVPVIASNHVPFKRIIRHGETGFLADSTQDWLEAVGVLINQLELRERIGINALKDTWRNYSFTHDKLKAYQDVFV